MTPQHIIAAAVFLLVFMVGMVGIIDAIEPGKTFGSDSAGELAVIALGLGGAAVGLSLAGVKWRRAKKPEGGEPADDERN